MRNPWLLCCLAAVLPALLYWQVIEFAYVWDDLALFLDSAALRGGVGFWDAVSQPILPGTTYFRPLVLATVYAEFQLGEPSPALSHSVNLVIFLSNCLLLGVLVDKFLQGVSLQRRLFALMVTILVYALHPAQVESVAWVAGRFDLMVTFFALLTLIFGLREGAGSIFLMALSFAAAALCKEMAATLPALLVLLQMARTDGVGFQRVLRALMYLRVRLVVLVLMGGLYLALRTHVMSHLFHQDHRVSDVLTPLSHLALIGHTLIYYARTVVAPFFNIGPIHPVDVSEFGVVQLCVGWSMLALVLAFVVWALLRGGYKSLMLVALLVALLPVLNIVPLTIGGNIGHERFLALPLVFAALAMGLFVTQLSRLALTPMFKGVLAGLVVFWLAASALVVNAQLPFWRSGYALWSWSYAKNPDFAFAQFSLVAEHLRSGRLDLAGQVLDEIDARGAEESRQLMILKASYLQRRGRYQEALDLMDEATKGVQMPHEAVIAAGVPLEDANISRETFSDGWTYRFIYGVRAESYLGMRRYKEMLEVARIGQFYQRDYAPLHLLEALALYGLDRLEEGDQAWRDAQSYYVYEGRVEADGILASFKRQECRYANSPVRFCGR